MQQCVAIEGRRQASEPDFVFLLAGCSARCAGHARAVRTASAPFVSGCAGSTSSRHKGKASPGEGRGPRARIRDLDVAENACGRFVPRARQVPGVQLRCNQRISRFPPETGRYSCGDARNGRRRDSIVADVCGTEIKGTPAIGISSSSLWRPSGDHPASCHSKKTQDGDRCNAGAGRYRGAHPAHATRGRSGNR